MKLTSCLVNPRACHETELVISPTAQPKRVAVVGAGPAGLACATTAADRGHDVTLFDAGEEIGGQLLMAKQVPGKEEFNETLRYFRVLLEELGVDVQLGSWVSAEDLLAPADQGGGFDAVVLATEWPEFRLIDPEGLRRVMRGDLVVDGRNCLPQAV